eukprot:1205463-Pyramimonas_sp.AAC.1
MSSAAAPSALEGAGRVLGLAPLAQAPLVQMLTDRFVSLGHQMEQVGRVVFVVANVENECARR